MVDKHISNFEINAVLIPKRNLLLVDTSRAISSANPEAVLTISKNIEDLGFVFSQALFNVLKYQPLDDLVDLHDHLESVLCEMVGAHVEHKPFYPFFPEQMATLSEIDLYLNALLHYWTNGEWAPSYVRLSSLPIRDNLPQTRMIDLGTIADFHQIFTDMMRASGSLSANDKALLGWYLAIANPEDLALSLPEAIPSKETLSLVVAKIMAFHPDQVDLVMPFINTATDVLRLATALSNGDVSLALNTKFRNFSRSERRFLLALLEACHQLEEDMGRYPGKWKRLGEKLHPGDYAEQFPQTYAVFTKIRNGERLYSFAAAVKNAIKEGDLTAVLSLLETRPGEFARRLDYLARNFLQSGQEILASFSNVAERASSQVLLQTMAHFKQRHVMKETRSFFPKGNIAKVQVVENTLPTLDESFCQGIVDCCKAALIKRLSEKEPLGKVYIDPVLKDIMIPIAQRASSQALKTYARGSRFSLGDDATVIRAFIHWKNIMMALPIPEMNLPAAIRIGRQEARETDEGGHGIHAVSDWRDLLELEDDRSAVPFTDQPLLDWREIRTDIDLTLGLYDADWQYVDHISFTNIRSRKFEGLYHSGDIVDAPDGASEFIDLDIPALLAGNVRYAVFNVYSYTHQGFNEIPECFFGWMERKTSGSGEIFDPKSVVNKIDIASPTTICLPVLFDLLERKAVWMDLSLRSNPYWANNLEANRNNVVLMSRAMIDLGKPNLYDLFQLNAMARGEWVDDPTQADITIGLQDTDDVTPFQVERILSEFM